MFKDFNMYQSEYTVFFLIFLFLTGTDGGLTTSSKHKARVNYKLKLEHVTETFSCRSHSQCLLYCSMRPGCISTSFKSPSESCLLSNVDTISDASQSPGIPVVLEFAEGWNTMTKIIYPVFYALGQYERYSMNVNQATQQCIDYGTTIASPSDLQEARDMGFEYCRCGWLSNNMNGLVLQTYLEWCDVGFSVTIINCYRSTADAICKLK